jgi:type I site-specific restriction-modification system R (restriction) subunit
MRFVMSAVVGHCSIMSWLFSSQYGLKAKLNTETGFYVYGYAKQMRDAMPSASFIGFTGTPIEKQDANTQATFGGYVSIYNIEDAKEGKATVPIYYESRLAKLDINREEIDAPKKDVEEVIEDEEDLPARESTKGKWAELAKLVGAKERVEAIAAEFGGALRTRTSVLEGKAMVVVLGMNHDEEAFYDALADRPEVLLTMGDDTLKKLAGELTGKLRNSTTVDWQFRDSVRARMRILIRQLLRKYKYPPEGCEEAIGLVLKQAEALADEWTSQ